MGKKLASNFRFRMFLSLGLILLSTILFAITVRFYDSNKLSSNLISDICQDRHGYIWIATGYGLNKFDGVHFTHYFNDPNDKTSISSNTIKGLQIDTDGTLWVKTSNSVQKYNMDDDAFQEVTMPNGDKPFIKSLTVAADGNLLILSSKSGLFKVDRNTMTATPFTTLNRSLKDSKFSKLFADSKLRLWLCTENGRLVQCSYHGIRKEFFTDSKESLGKLDYEKKIISVFEYKKRIYAVTHHEIFLYNERSANFENYFNSQIPINHVYEDKNSNFWIVSDGQGLFSFNIEGKILTRQYQNLNNGIDLTQQKIAAFYKGSDNHIWLGCFQKGLFCIGDKVRPFNYVSLGENSFLQMLFADSKGHIYTSLGHSGLDEITPEGNISHSYLPGLSVITAYENQDGSLWIGTDDKGACLFNPATQSTYWIDSLNGLRIKAFTKDRNGNVYFAAFNKGLYCYDATGRHQLNLCHGKMQLHNQYLMSLMTDSKNRVWIGHYYGLDVYDAYRDKLLDIPMDSVLRKATTFSLVETDNGDVWAGTNKGLFRFNDKAGKWTQYGMEDGLPNECICSVIDSKDGYLWISTFKGLSKMDIQKGTFANYYKGNGLQFWNYSRGIACRSVLGLVCFGNDNGFTYFLPRNVDNHTFIRDIKLTGVLMDGKRISRSTISGGRPVIDCAIERANVIRFSYTDNTFTLLFSTMDYRDADNVAYQYRFKDEKENVWHATDAGISEITLSHLSWGKHDLQVRACDNGEYSAVKTICIHILPPWYASWWAYIIYLFIISSLLYLAWNNYIHKRISNENEAKIRLFVDFSHELRSPLTLIKNPLDSLIKKDFDDDTRRALANMKRNTDRLLLVVNQILSIRKIEKGQMRLHYAETDLAEFTQVQCENFEYLAEKNEISLTFNCQENHVTAWIDCEQFDKIISNLIANALKYVKKGGEIAVTLSKGIDSKGKPDIILKVADTGPGIDEKQISRIFERFYQTDTLPTNGQLGFGIGLNLARKLVSLHGGTIEAHNREDQQGTVFIITLPTGREHLSDADIVDKHYFLPDESLKQDNIPDNQDIIKGTQHPTKKKTSYKVAVVDDDEEILNYLNAELGKIYHIKTFKNGKDALPRIIEDIPDAVISDIKMPEMDGFTLMKRIKSNTKTSHIPVLLLTTEVESRSKIEGFDYGADAYVDKPFDMEELKARLAALIANRTRMKGKFSGAQEQQGIVQEISIKGNDEDLMERIMKILNERLSDEEFNVSVLAEEIGLSRVQLHRRLKEITGIPASDFIRNFRLQQAAKMLEAGNVNISQITYAIGLTNPTHFSNAFKKYFGVSPKEYMQNHAEKGSQSE